MYREYIEDVDLSGLVVAALSAAVAALTAYFAYRQAKAAREQAEAAREQVRIAREDASAALEQARAAEEQAEAARDQATAAREQARAAAELAAATDRAVQLERARQIEERSPKIAGRVHFVSPSGHRLELRLESPRPLTSLACRIISDAVQFIDEQSANRATFGQVSPGSTASFWVSVSDSHPKVAQIEVVSAGEDSEETWTTLLDVPIFPELEDSEPEVALSIQFRYPEPHQLELQLLSDDRVSGLSVEICSGYGVRFSPKGLSQSGASSVGRRKTSGPLSRDEIASWPIIVERSHSNDVGLEVVVTGEQGQRWTLRESVSVPDSGPPELSMRVDSESSIPRRLLINLVSAMPIRNLRLAISEGANFLRRGQSPNIRAGDAGRPTLGQAEQPQQAVVGDLLPGQTARLPVEWVPGSPFFWLDVATLDVDGQEWEWRETVHIPSWLQRY